MVSFLLGLAVAVGFWVWQQIRFKRKLQHLLETFGTEVSEVSLPLIPRLRREIALQNQRQQQLLSQLQTWETLLESAPIGYLQVDDENQLLWCNPKARQLLGLQKWKPGQLRLLLELVRSYELDRLIEQTRDRGAPQIQEWLHHPDCSDAAAISHLQKISLRASSLLLPQEQVGVFIENQQPIVEIIQTRDRLVSDLAHELKTPLTSIRLVIETLQQQIDLPWRRLIDRLLPEVDRLINLVQNWLEISHLELEPHKKLNLQPVELQSLIYSVWQNLEPIAQERHLQLDYSQSAPLWIKADKSRLTQVFLNLLHNSIKYSPAEATIHVIINLLPTKTAPKQVQINVIDSGKGFPIEDLPYVFDRLYRCEADRNRHSVENNTSLPIINGSGLGLAIAQQIVLAHGGTIKAKNHPDTGGAWLQVELPKIIPNLSN
ncbi:PAS domain-containing sensor histidine kinase [Synechocystis sp. PCC 7509]|uniref:PAS domain-containing sensor histidine kinase n=1 Tax=Synechocystis sp. PCC 7509 TaxID=927677 RepID=UPI0002AC6DCC|nr:PAS domain-containing sensor histidine kinase [Synechocystis sp. PCC 7509]